jgi:predicted transcriptional regulator YheO
MERSREVDSTITDVAQECLRDSESIRKKTMNEYDSLVGKDFKGSAAKVLDAASAMEPGGAVH